MEKHKVCFKCGESKPLTEFYKQPKMSDGHVGKCKSCTCAAVRKHRNENVEKARAYDRERAKTPIRKAHFAEKQRKKRASDSKYTKAHNAVIRAIAKGTLIRPKTCGMCAVICKPDAHHDDHERTMDVMWLCSPCHAQRHVELGLIKMRDD